MAEELTAHEIPMASREETPDVVVVNTCTVTREATKASRTAIRRAVKDHPNAKVVVIGCYAVSDPEEITAIEGVDVVLGNDEKEQFVEALARSEVTRPLLQIRRPAVGWPRYRVRSNLKVQTGCDE